MNFGRLVILEDSGESRRLLPVLGTDIDFILNIWQLKISSILSRRLRQEKLITSTLNMLKSNISQLVQGEWLMCLILHRWVFRRELIISSKLRHMKKRLSRSQKESTHSNPRFFYQRSRWKTNTIFPIESFPSSTLRKNTLARLRPISTYGKATNQMNVYGSISTAGWIKTRGEWGDLRSRSRSTWS